MNAPAYRHLRIAVGGATLAFCALVFADIGNWVGADAARAGLWLQAGPAWVGLASGLGWIAVGGVVVLALTVLLGRVYCAMLCPLGVLMDLAAAVAKRTGKRRRLPYQAARRGWRPAVAALAAGGLLLGTALPLAWLEPYSLFGKICTATLRPVFEWCNHSLAAMGWIRPVTVSPVAPAVAVTALVLAAGIIVLAILRGRLWCNTVCPVGAVLGWVARYSRWRLRITHAACVSCAKCERVCPAQCIDFRAHEIDHSRCVMCLDCVSSCGRSGIRLENAWRRTAPAAAAADVPVLPVNRRGFLAAALPVAAAAVGPGAEKSAVAGARGRRAVLPPGAISLDHFQHYCTACQLCVANCPDQVLRPSLTKHGLAGFFQPFQDFEVSFCSYNCSNCSQICPTGALQPLTVDERRKVRTGAVELDIDLCVVKTKGTSCGACSEHCPTQAVHMVPWERGLTLPEIDPTLCVGCGGCEFICPVRPVRAIVVNGLRVHERAKVVKLGQHNTVRPKEEEFPF